jgi:1,4-alpha-glucan branching enzyme
MVPLATDPSSVPGGAASEKVAGYLALVLHAHLPFVRHPEHEDFLEENWLYEALTETYIPLLQVMERLVKDKIDFRLTLSITPTLVSMLADPLLQHRCSRRLERLLELAEKEIRRNRHDPGLSAVAVMYRRRLQGAFDLFVNRYGRDIIGGFIRLQNLGKVEIIASAATHAFLPLFSVNEAAVRAQVRIGLDNFRDFFGQEPQGFWLPECGFFPGVDKILVEEGIRYSIVETHGITRARPKPKYGVYAPVLCPSGMAVFGRDPESSKQVWSSLEGYPGDYDYREFYRDIAYDLDLDYLGPYIHPDGIRVDTGFKYYRITGKTGRKEVYIPAHAEKKTEIHAGNFLFNREREIENFSSVMDRKPLVVAPYDAELFGHWWFEGPLWLDRLIRKIHGGQKTVRLITLSEYLEEYPINQISHPSASSWGNKGFSETWCNGSNDWALRHLHQSASFMEKLAANHPRPRGLMRRALNQAARELLLAQASDWPFMINSGAMAEYAAGRIKTHLLRFLRLKAEIEEGKVDEDRLSAVESQDNIFPHIDYRVFSPSETRRTTRQISEGRTFT